MDLEECKRKGFVKMAKPSVSLAKSLVEIANIKEIAIKSIELNETTVIAYVPLAYDSLRETLEALCTLEGYKVTNHVCLGELLRTLISDFDYISFDRFRYIRNGINYYGRKIGLEEGKEIIKKIFIMKKKIIKVINSKIRK